MQWRKLIFWLFKEAAGGVWPRADKYILLIFRITYLCVKLFLWVFLGKKRRDQSKILIKISRIIYSSPSLCFFKYLYKVRKILGFSIPTHLKIDVPKYGYRVYCPINVSNVEFINLTTHEEEIIEHFRPTNGDVVVDIGAYIGRYTLIASKRVGLNGKVISVEANPNNFEILNRNVRLNQLSNVIRLNYAVYSQETKIKLYLPDERSGRFDTLMSGRANKGKVKFVEINSITLDHLLQLQGIREVNWIKIDVEGAEYEVLKGATNIISQSKDISLLIEIHSLSKGKTLYEPITKFLTFHNLNIDYERTYEGGERHVIARKGK